MANNSPTIVAASLSDDKLKKSIESLVTHVDEAMKKMVQSTNNAVGEMEAKLKSLGNFKIDSGGSADGGASKRAKAQNVETDAVEKSIAARDKQIKKNQEVKMSFDQMQTALEKATRLPSEMRMPDMAKSARESFQAFYKGFNEQARRLEPLIQSWEKLLQARHTGNIEQVAQQIRNVKSEIAAVIREQANLSKTKPQGYIDEIAKRNTQIKALRDQLASLEAEQQRLKASDPFKDNPYLNTLRERLAQVNGAMRDTETTNRHWIQTTNQLTEAQRKSVEEQMKLFYARTMKIPTDQYDMQIAKLERINSMLERYRRGEVSFTPAQLSGLEKEAQRLQRLLGQANVEQQHLAQNTQQTTQSAQRYTEEIRKQAQAIRESAEYKAGKYVSITTPSGYDAVINIKDRISIEDKLTEAYQKHIGQKSVLDRIEQTDNEVAKERLGTETAITNEISKRKKYSTPETQLGYDVTRDKLAQIIATRNNIQRNQVVNWDEQTSSIKTLSAALKQYQEAYVKMSATERNSPFGKQMIADMQVLERNIQKFRQQLSRPIDFESVMNLPQKTLDDMAYKMRQLASYRSGLNVETQVKEIEQVNKKYVELQKNMNDIMQKNTNMIASNTSLGRSWNYMKNRLAFYFTVGASTSFIKNLIDIRSQYELLERSIGILFDSMQTGSKIFSELNQMAIKSPFTTMELGSAAKQLSAYNIAAKDVVDTTRRLADMAAAVGIPIERLTYALGQIKSYGYLNSRDARMFANAGIPLIQNLADMYTKLEGRLVSIGDVYDRIKKKQVSFEDTLKVVHEMTDEGGRFFNFQEKAADTLKVRLANLTLAWNNMLNNMGKSNQGVLTSGLGVLKEMFENWRKIENLVLAIATNFGTVKAIQLLILLNAKGVTKQMALQEVLGKKLGTTIYGIARNLKMLAVNPMTWLTVAITAVTYLSWKFWDLTTANENFNKSIADGTKENIASINKFFDKYRKDIESVGSMKTTDQEKMWERVREEIEKTTKNAQQYIDILEKIPELDKRVGKASGFLEQEKVIQDELNRLAQHGYFNIGGGFADDSYAETLTAIDKYTGEMIRKYGTYEDYIKAFKNEFQGFYDEFKDKKFSWNINEEIDESVNHFKKLENLNWGRILSGGTDEEKLARIRDTFMSLRDNFFATEEMQNAGAEAQALYNRHMDYWITSIAKANGLIKELTVNGKTYSAEDIASVEERRTEWELFFSYLSDEQRKTMDYLVKTNQTGGEEFKIIWNTAADSMKKSNATAYRDLQKKIAELRETPDIVINVVYREMRDKLDEQQQDFEDRWIKPKNWSVRGLSAEDYLKEETANRTKYGRLMRKAEEDNVEWEERLGKEYQENKKKIKSLNAQLQNKNKLSEADRKQKEKDLNLYKDLNKAIYDIGKAENFNYDQFKKGGKGSKKDPLLDTLKQEISIVEKLQSGYDKLSKSGASQADALDTIRGAYGKTIRLLNAQLESYGLPQIDISQLITGKDPHKTLEHFKNTLDTLVGKGILTLERSKELEAVIEKLTLSAKTYDLDKITKGLNNELDMLKEEYELAVAIDADPELGGIFADMFDLNIDQLPHTISEYAQKVTAELNKAIKDRGDSIQLPTIYLTKDDIDAFRKMSEDGKLNTKSFEVIQKAYQDFVSLRKKAATDVSKIASDYIREYGDLSAQIQQIEIEKNDALMKLNEIYNTDALRQTRRYLDAKFAIEDGAKRKQAKAAFDALKKEADYERFFTAIDTLTKKDALSIKNKIKKGIIDAFKNGGLTISQFRKEIKALEEQFDKLSQPTSNWISYLNGGFDKLIQRAKETGQEIEAIGEKISVTGKVDEEDKNYLQSLGNMFSNGKGGNTDFSSLMSQFGKDMKGLGSNISKAGQGMQGASSNFASTVSIIDMIIKNIHQTVQGINSVIQELDSVRNEENKISNAYWEGFSKSDSYASSGWENLKSGNISGAIADTANSIISIFNTFENAKTDRINSEIKESEREIKRLENSYKTLEFAADKAYGTAISGANQATKANKELQLAELKRQLALEQSRSGKARDEDKIIQLRGDIIELEQQIEKSSKDIINNLLDISSHGDFFEEMISEMISAFKNGEDAMKVFEEKWSAMIDNMIMKTIVSQVLSQWINTLERGADEILNRYTEESAKKMTDAESSMANLRTMDAGDFARWIYENDKENFDKILESLGERNDVEQFFSRDAWFDQAWDSGLANKIKEAYFAMLNSNMSGLQSELDKASLDATGELIDYYAQAGDDFKQNYLDLILAKIKENWKFGEDSQKELSALQQGIQGITEDTAGALEGITNGISQQCYLQSDLLTQIRDAVVSMDVDVSLGVMSQILLQLQSSYQTQQAIQQILESVLVPSGRAFAVELLS